MTAPAEARRARREGPFWLRPKWVAGHVIALVLVVLFVNLGFWQLRRLEERRDRNAVIEARSAQPVQPVGAVVDPGAGFAESDALVYRQVSARGTYDIGGEVLIRSRSLDGQPGYHVLTPLVTDEGPALAVNRGFVPRSGDEVVPAPPPGGEVEVSGILLPTQERAGIGPTDPAGGTLAELARADLGRLQQQYDTDLYPLLLQLRRQEPPPGELPVVLPDLDRHEGPHLGYAVQWFLFAGVGAVGWPVLLRRTAATEP